MMMMMLRDEEKSDTHTHTHTHTHVVNILLQLAGKGLILVAFFRLNELSIIDLLDYRYLLKLPQHDL